MTPERQRIVILAGFSAAGKSTLGRELRDGWGYNLIEHQPLVHSLASNKGFIRARDWLAAEGIGRFTDESTSEMAARTRTALDASNAKIVLDVAYGVEMLEFFQNEFPNICLLVVSVMADEDTRATNIQGRMGTESVEEAEEELAFRDKFLHQVGLSEVLKRKNLEIINMGKPIHEVASELNRLIEENL